MSETQATVSGSKVVFLCEDRPFDFRDLIDAAHFRGELEPIWKNLLRLIAAERKADADELEVDDEAIESAAEQFRYERDLITAEETERWLAERGLTLNDFGAHFVRHHWDQDWTDVEVRPVDYVSTPNDLRDLLLCEVILSGEVDQMARRLSRRVAARCAARPQSAGPALIAEERTRFLERHGMAESQLDDWLERLGRDADWLREMLAMEAIHRRACTRADGDIVARQATRFIHIGWGLLLDATGRTPSVRGRDHGSWSEVAAPTSAPLLRMICAPPVLVPTAT